MPSASLQPAILGGLVIGILSALPIINMGNCCCCLWVTSGGVLAAYLLQASSREPIDPGDGALVGLLAGLVGAVVFLVISLPISVLVGPIQARMIERLIENASDLPGGMRDAFESMRTGSGGLSIVIGFAFQLVSGAVFSTVGGLLGALFFRRGKTAPEVPADAALPSGPGQL
jgi:hypothetical protein